MDTQSHKPSKYHDPIAVNYMTDDQYQFFSMDPFYRENLISKEKAFFETHEHLLSRGYRDFVNAWIFKLLKNQPIQETDDTNKIKSYHELMMAEFQSPPLRQTMITPKIKSLFQFVEFLHSNIENFKQHDGIINELHLLDVERNKLRPKQNFKDKLKYDEVQSKLKDKFNVIKQNIITPIRSKATELKVCNFDNEPRYYWHGIETEIENLKNNFINEDLPDIFKHKKHYIEYRIETNCSYFQDLFFDELDEVMKELFDFFKETDQNEFEPFETKAIKVNDIGEAIKLFQQGHKKFTLSRALLSKPPQRTERQEPELNKASILFNSPEITTKLHRELKGYFTNKEKELQKALDGEQLSEPLLFPHNQNKFVEVFKRVKYNGFLLSTPKEIENWICLNFRYKYQKGKKKEVRRFNSSTVHDILTKDKGEPTKNERICVTDWLPYKSHLARQRGNE